MESNKLVYTIFTKFVIALVAKEESDLKKTKDIVKKCFKVHPFYPSIEKVLKREKLPKQSAERLFDRCVSICEDFGPDRDYITLIFVLKEIDESTKNEDIEKYIKRLHKIVDQINASIPAPPLYNVMLESRSVLEWTSMHWIYYFIPKRKTKLKKPVLFMPPYLGNDYTTKFVRRYLKSLGFKTYKWELGVNMINSKYLPKLEQRLNEIYDIHQQKVSLVGWSGGGIFAKLIANRFPDKVEQLVTIGSPVWGIKHMKTPVIKSLEFLRGKQLRERNRKFIKEMEEIPDVPITCIYTKTDGLVPWKHCLEAETYRDDIKNIEVFGSHSGMGANATVLLTVANALTYNLQENHNKTTIEKIESLFFPKFWQEKGLSKFTKLFVN